MNEQMKQAMNARHTVRKFNGPMSGIDKGIVKHHFELGAGKEYFEWA